MKYTLVTISGIHTQIAKPIAQGYTEGVIEAFLPDDDDLKNEKEEAEWIATNNKRMEAICKFLNDNDL